MLAIDLHEHLVQVPTSSVELDALDPALPNLGCKHRAEPMPPEPDRLMAHVDAALVEQILDVPKRKRETNVQHHRQADDLGARLEVLEGKALGYGQRLRNCHTRLKAS
jgi:hypothetical protein